MDNVLQEAGLNTIADVLERLEGGEKALLDISGFGRKSLIDLKKALRQEGYKIPEAAEEITV
jgi:large subunit ribosomal protein L31